MALPPLAAVSDLAAWVGASIDDADPRAGAVLSAASALVRSYTGETWTDEADVLTDVPEAVSAVVVQVAARVWFNPAGLTSATVDDATRRWGEGGASGLYLTDSDKDTLTAFVSNPTTGITTVGTTRGDLGIGTVFVPTVGGPPFPWYAEDDLL